MVLNQTQTQKLKALMLANNKPAYFVVDPSLKLLDWSDNLLGYGFYGLEKGIDSTEIFDFMVGHNPDEDLELPIVTMPTGIHGSVSSVRYGDEITVLILDASRDFEQQYLLQQKANDAQLLNLRLQSLLKELVSTRQELEEKNAKLAEASRLQSRFLSGVSHEFRTPLTSLIGYSEVLLEKTDDALCVEYLDIIRDSSKYMLALVENLLDHGRLDSNELSLQFSSINLVEFVESILNMLRPIAEKKGLELRGDIKPSDELILSIDEVRVRQCLLNLLNNAIKFTDRGWVQLIVNWQADELIIDVVDTGIGMDQEDIESLYAPFWQSQKHAQVGTGLGMTITQRLVDLMGGDISVKSELNTGTAVRLTIPAVIAEVHEVLALTPAEDSQEVDRSWKKILVVEDDSDIADLVMLRLKEWGYDAEHCHNGSEAIDWLESQFADMVLLDLNMPVMNGEQALKKIRARGNNVPVYIMSAKPLDIEGNDQFDAQGQIVKPLDFNLLQIIIADCLDC